MTAKQLSHKIALSMDCCGYILSELSDHKLVACLNGQARRSRLYWLTTLGKIYQQKLRESRNLPQFDFDFPKVDWQLYGWVCFSHRQAVIRALTEPMQPAAIKRKARSQNAGLRMSANNVRDIIRLFLSRRIVRPVNVHRKAHLRYELTELGRKFRTLLLEVEGID